jgi:hypothetical protein
MKAFISYILAISLTVPVSSLSAARVGGQTSPPAPSDRPAAAAQPPDGGWPRAYDTTSGGRIVLYEPQVASWPDQKHMVMYAAVAYTASGANTPTLGTLKIEANTQISVPERLVNFSEFTITESNFPKLSRDQLTMVVGEITSSVPRNERVIGLDRVLAAVDTSEITPKNVDGVKADPPVIFFSQRPAILVNIDEEPMWSPIKDNNLRFAVNTNWDLFALGTPETYYLRNGNAWMTASKVDGPWTPAHKLPDSFFKLPDDGNWKDVKAALSDLKPAATVPTVFVSKRPAELIEMTGAPAYIRVSTTQLLWVSNTESDVFRLGKDGPVYFLVSGRWFTAPGFSGPWTFATPSLPDDFKRIPLEHPRSRVLASVPGTPQAIEAVLLAEVPETARVNRKEVQAPEVIYAGDPRFEPIEQMTISRAVNTDKDVLKIGDLYYMCFDGVWFVARGSSGPWTVADSIPKEVYEIPISSPAYDVTAVTVEESDADWVEFATAAAYTGTMVAWGVAMWGSGYYYPPYFGYWGGGYPAYIPRYPSYGYGARYNPWTGAYSRGGAVYGPYGGAGYGARYNPSTGTYARGAVARGPGGARGAAQAWNPRTGTYAQTRQGSNVYGSWGSTAVQRNDQWATTSRVTNRATGTTTRATQGSGGGGIVSRNTLGPGGAAIGKTAGGNVYAGRDGNVYRNQGGSWQSYNNGSWGNVQRPTGTSGQLGAQAGGLSSSTRSQLNHDFNARSDGAARTRDLGSVRSGSRPSGSYRPSGGGRSMGGGSFRGGGGGFRGGGGRR